MINQVKLLSVTAFLTLLIWVAADQLQVVSATVNVSLRFEPRDAESAMVVRLAGAEPFEVVVSGPRRAVQPFEDMQTMPLTLRLADRPTNPREPIADLLALLREEPGPLKDLVIESVHPAEAVVAVDRWIEVDVPVAIAQPMRLAYEIPPELESSTVKVRLWESRLKELGGRIPPIDLPLEKNLAELREGGDFSVRVSVPLEGFGEGAASEPRAVKVTGRLAAQKLETRELGLVAIRACVGFDYLNRRVSFEVESGGTVATRKITVQGTPEALRKLAQTPAYGVLNLREEEMKRVGEDQFIQPDFFLPEGVTMVGKPDPVKLRIVSISEE